MQYDKMKRVHVVVVSILFHIKKLNMNMSYSDAFSIKLNRHDGISRMPGFDNCSAMPWPWGANGV